MNIAFLLTTLAGLSTMIGIFPIFIHTKKENYLISGTLSFASGVMITVSITDLIPESINLLRYNIKGIYVCVYSLIFILLGIYTSFIIDKYITKKKENNSLYKLGIISMLAIILHNIPEGIITYISTTKNIKLGIKLATVIAIHNIPEGISIGVPIYYGTKSKLKTITYIFISALSELLGAVLTYLFLLPLINNLILGLLFSFTGGIMIHISLGELLPNSKNYSNNYITYLFFIIGIITMLLKIIL